MHVHVLKKQCLYCVSADCAAPSRVQTEKVHVSQTNPDWTIKKQCRGVLVCVERRGFCALFWRNECPIVSLLCFYWCALPSSGVTKSQLQDLLLFIFTLVMLFPFFIQSPAITTCFKVIQIHRLLNGKCLCREFHICGPPFPFCRESAHTSRNTQFQFRNSVSFPFQIGKKKGKNPNLSGR